MNIANAVDRFTRQLAANGRSVHTQAAYRRDLEGLGRWIGGRPALGKITPDLLARFLTSDAALLSPSEDPRSPMSVNRTKSALRSFFAFCQESGWLRENPARLIRSSPTSPKEPSLLTEKDIGRLRDVCGACGTRKTASRDRLVLELLLGTGMRLGSLVSLNIGDIDLKSGIAQIRTKGNGRDKVFLNPELQRLIARHLRNTDPEANTSPASPLFRSVHGRRLGARQIQLNFAKWCREAGVTASVHSLRHTFATRLYHKTGDLHLVQRALGHRQITTTEIYATMSDQSLRRAISRP
jgi:integrase/recombinase XerC